MNLREPSLTIQAIDKHLEQEPREVRDYMGISSLGGPCDRAIWLRFRWADFEEQSGRMLRLFDRGQREEKEVATLLKSVGVQVQETGKDQREVQIGAWVKGHCDGIITSGLLESPNNPHILEIKTSNAKAFKEMQEQGVQKAKPMHYAQMQLYMYATGIERAFYWMVCKDTDEVYTERIHLDRNFAEILAKKGNDLAMTDQMPKANGNAFYYECKFCPFYGICFKDKEVNKTCRTCKHGKFCQNGTFSCSIRNQSISKNKQLQGCSYYSTLPCFEKDPWKCS